MLDDTTPSSARNRRPIAPLFRGAARSVTRACVRRGVSPDVISAMSILASLAAAGLLVVSREWPLLLWVVPALLYLRLYCNMLDGMVAIAAGKASKRGELWNELPDRLSDALVFIGLALSGWCSPHLAYSSGLMALGVAYTGTMGQAMGVGRRFNGWMSKPWRMVAVHAGLWLQATAVALGAEGFFPGGRTLWGLSALDAVLLVILVGGVQTCVVRTRAIWRCLGQDPQDG